jgi:hypothetical protein
MADWMYAHTLPIEDHPAGCQCDGCQAERCEFNASHIDQHGMCPQCAAPVRTYKDDWKTTHTCDVCGYHDVTFNWISD